MKLYLILFLSRAMNFLVLDEFLFHQKKILHALKLQQSQFAFGGWEDLRDFDCCGRSLLPLPLRHFARRRVLLLLLLFRFVSHSQLIYYLRLEI